MSADDELSITPADAMAPDMQSHKRKASAEVHDSELNTSPKRAKLESKEETPAEATASGQELKPETTSATEQTGIERRSTSEVSQAHSPTALRDSRSPTLSRKPSIPQAQGPGADRGRSRINDEEKKRGQRLFGGLLSTLSRKTDTSQQKKRQEIERRQQERAQAHKIEDDKRRAEKLAKLNHVRKIEQVKWDEQVMNTRHSSLLARAKSLSTKAEPKIYFLPWKLTEPQEAIIKQQRRDAEEQVAQEKADFARQRVQRLKELGVTVSEPDPHEDTDTGAPTPDESSSRMDVEPSHPKNADQEQSPSIKPLEVERPPAGHEKDHDDAGYVMVEAAEDTVIY